MRRLAWLVLSTFLPWEAVMAAEPGYDRVAGRAHASRSEVIAPHGMAATSQPLATQIALDILKAGGSAVDAAIAANAALGLMEPTGSGIGGDLFAIVWDAEKKELTGLNASGRAPQGDDPRVFPEERASSRFRHSARCPSACPGPLMAGSSCTAVTVACRWRRSLRRRFAMRARAFRFRRSSRTTS